MSMTRGPIVPPKTGSSTDFPVALSVNVIVPVTILFPSIDPPLSPCPQPVDGFDRKNRLLPRDWQTRALGRCHWLGSVGDPTAALLWPQHPPPPKDTRRGRRPGEGRPQRGG